MVERAPGSIVDADAYERIALGDDDRHWELHDGVLAEKVVGTWARNEAVVALAFGLMEQIDRRHFTIRIDSARVACGRTFVVPDVLIVPMQATAPLRGYPDRLEVYRDPALFVSEAYPPPGDDQDAAWRLAVYMERGDREVWRLHPYERTAAVWRRQPDGSYAETVHLGGRVEVASLPGVVVDLDAVFAP